jgi:hypothetical protein
MDWLDEERKKNLLASPLWKPPHLPQFQFQFQFDAEARASQVAGRIIYDAAISLNLYYIPQTSPEHSHLWWRNFTPLLLLLDCMNARGLASDKINIYRSRT